MTISAILQIFMIVFMIGLAGFCFALTRRLRKLNDLETGLGGAILSTHRVARCAGKAGISSPLRSTARAPKSIRCTWVR